MRCADGSLYIGHTTNVEMRVNRHNSSEASIFTARRRPVTLEYVESFTSDASAIARERQLKRWTRAKKEALIAGDRALLKRL